MNPAPFKNIQFLIEAVTVDKSNMKTFYLNSRLINQKELQELRNS